MTDADDARGLEYVFGPLRAQPASLVPRGARWRTMAHARGVVDLAIVDATAITLGGTDEELARWDLRNGAELERIPLPFTPRRIACSADGRLVAVGSALDDGVEVWPLGDRTAVRVVPSQQTTAKLGFLRSDLLLVVDGIATAWVLDDEPRVAWQVRADAERSERLQHAVVLDEAIAVLVVDREDRRGTIDIHRVSDGQLVRSVAVAEPFARNDLDGAFVRSPAGDAVAWGHAYGDGEVRIIDLADGHIRARIRGPGTGVGTIAWTEASLLVGHADGSVRAYDPTSGTSRGIMAAHAGWIAALAMLTEADMLTAGTDGTLQRWAPAALEEAVADSIGAQAIFALGDSEVLALDATTIARRRFDAVEARWSAPRPKGEKPRIAIAAEHGWIAVAQTNPSKTSSVAPQATCVVLDADTGTMRGEWAFAGEVRSAVHANGRCWIATLAGSHFPDSERPLVAIDPGSDAHTRFAAWGHAFAHAIVHVPANGPLVVALNDGRIVTISTRDGSVVAAAKEHTKRVTALALAAAGQLVSIGDDGTVRVWEPDPLALMRGFAAEPNPRPRMEVVAHALVDGGRAIAIGTGLAVLEVFDLASARRRVRIELPAPLAAVAASPDGEWMATALQDGSVLVYSASGEIIGRREFPGVPRQIVVVGAHEIAVRDRGARLHGLVVRG